MWTGVHSKFRSFITKKENLKNMDWGKKTSSLYNSPLYPIGIMIELLNL